MPMVIEPPEQLEYVETYNLTIERSLVQPERSGFWRTLMHKIIEQLTPTPYQQRVPVCHNASRPYETAMDRVVRMYPSFAPYALAII